MNLLRTIKDIDIGVDSQVPSMWRKRKAARAVVFDRDKNIALLNVTKKDYHKLPGGGIEEGEDIETALRREVMEEIGCVIENIRELGIIEEYRNHSGVHQTSYCFVADIKGDKGSPNFVGDEIDDGFQPEWMSLKEAIKILEDESDIQNIDGKFIRLRDLTFLEWVAR